MRSLKITAALMLLLTAIGICAPPPAGAAEAAAFDHLTTGFELTGAHRDVRCESCHADGVFKATPRACAACHAVEPGGAASPRERAVPFASLEMRHTVGLDGRLADLTRRGHYGMPPIALDAGELTDLQAYIESLHRD